MDYNILTTDGNIGFYKSCEVTEIFLQRKSDKAIFNFFTLAVFEEKPFDKTNQQFLGERIKINEDFSIGILRYWFLKSEANSNFLILKSQNKWNYNGKNTSQFPKLKYLPKQYVPSSDGNRLNHVLKNNFHCGSYILEFFDEEKINVAFLLKMELLNKFNELSEKIKKYLPIDLSVVRDRIGNFIFQFPITIIEAGSKALPTWDGVKLNFSWHTTLSKLPDCLLQVESIFDNNYMGSVIEEYNKTSNQTVKIGNLDQINHIKIWRKEPSLILSNFSGTYLREFDFNIGLVNPEPRIFEVEGNLIHIQVTGKDKNKKTKKQNYAGYISNNLYDAEKRQLEKSLSFKQYKKGVSNAINDLQKLIMQKDENGVFLWDPFLSSLDILKTLYYSTSGGVNLRAISSINDAVKNVYHFKGKEVEDIIKEYKEVLDNPKNNNLHLNLEFRIQHTNFGWAFHDRFLIFPGSESKRSEVYSLGTSVNSYGQNHHILQLVSYPQLIVDTFNELWDELNKPECLVWKFPKK